MTPLRHITDTRAARLLGWANAVPFSSGLAT
jgi:hypothetical protein